MENGGLSERIMGQPFRFVFSVFKEPNLRNLNIKHSNQLKSIINTFGPLSIPNYEVKSKGGEGSIWSCTEVLFPGPVPLIPGKSKRTLSGGNGKQRTREYPE